MMKQSDKKTFLFWSYHGLFDDFFFFNFVCSPLPSSNYPFITFSLKKKKNRRKKKKTKTTSTTTDTLLLRHRIYPIGVRFLSSFLLVSCIRMKWFFSSFFSVFFFYYVRRTFMLLTLFYENDSDCLLLKSMMLVFIFYFFHCSFF